MTALVGDGVADDTVAIQERVSAGICDLPAGNFRVTSDIHSTAASANSKGFRLRGAGMLATTIIADYNGDASLGAILRLDTAAISQYTYDTEISNLGIQRATGRTGLNGIQLTAAFFVDIHHVMIKGLSGHGIIATIRPDIHPTISDYYQSFAVDLHQLYIRECIGWGIKFAAGQSPGCYNLARSMIWGNTGGGVLSTTGQCQIVGNAISENGTFGTDSGGIKFDTAEGPSMVADVRQNEIDCNYNYNMYLRRSRAIRVTQNRFLSTSQNDQTGQTRVNPGIYMRPLIDVKISDPGTEVTRALFEQNIHRSGTMGAQQVTAQKLTYVNGGGTLYGNRLWYNDIDHADGFLENSAGTIKYSGFSGTDTLISDATEPPVVPPNPSGDLIAKANISVATPIYASRTGINFNVVSTNVGNCVNAYTFTAPATGSYTVTSNMRFNGLASGQSILVEFVEPGNGSVEHSQSLASTGSSLQDFNVSRTLTLAKGQRVMICATVPAPAKSLNVADPASNWYSVNKL